MLVLTRKVGERVVIGGSVVVEVIEVRAGRVRFGIQAPQGVTVLRQELLQEANAGVQGAVKQRLTSIL